MRSTGRLGSFARAPVGPVIAVGAVAVLWAMSTLPSALARVPDLRRGPSDAAAATAQRNGFTVVIVERDGGGIAGTVVGQDPSPGTYLRRGEAVTLEVSRGAPQVAVPDLAGMPVDQARDALEDAGLRLGDVRYRVFRGREPGRVVSSDPGAGADLDRGSSVEVVAVLG